MSGSPIDIAAKCELSSVTNKENRARANAPRRVAGRFVCFREATVGPPNPGKSNVCQPASCASRPRRFPREHGAFPCAAAAAVISWSPGWPGANDEEEEEEEEEEEAAAAEPEEEPEEEAKAEKEEEEDQEAEAEEEEYEDADEEEEEENEEAEAKQKTKTKTKKQKKKKKQRQKKTKKQKK